MPDVRLVVTRSGWSTVQDLGRTGYSRYGISVGGSADQYSARCANALVANDQTQPLIESTAQGLAFVPSEDVLIAVTGAPCDVTVGGRPAARWQPLAVPAGAPVEITQLRDGLRVYLAVNGRLAVPPVLGSVAPDTGLDVGRRLRDGDELGLVTEFRAFAHPFSGIPLLRPVVEVPRFGSPWLVDVIEGPDAADFSQTADRLIQEQFFVEPQSDTVGLRLAGRAPELDPGAGTREILSRGVAVGSVEIPPSGQLLVLLRGRLLTAGYPVVAVVSTSAQSRLGQARPGDAIRFRPRLLADAVADARRERVAVDAVAAAVRTILRSSGAAS